MTDIERLELTLSNLGLTIDSVHDGFSVRTYTIEIPLGVDPATIMRKKSLFAVALDCDLISVYRSGARLIIEQPLAPKPVNFFDFSKGNNWMRRNLDFPLGVTQEGQQRYFGVDCAPHILVGGTTGSGKSVFLHNIICGVLMHAPDVEMFLIDPKHGAEFGRYDKLKNVHVYDTPEAGIEALEFLTWYMDECYKWMEDGRMTPTDHPIQLVVIDELADLMMTAGKTVEKLISRLAQMGRAVGVHLVVATQTPRANVVTGIIKANIPCRIGFHVTGKRESNIIFDIPDMGAETIINKGEMIALIDGQKQRYQAPYISYDDIEQVISLTQERHNGEWPIKHLAYDPDRKEEPKKEMGLIETLFRLIAFALTRDMDVLSKN